MPKAKELRIVPDQSRRGTERLVSTNFTRNTVMMRARVGGGRLALYAVEMNRDDIGSLRDAVERVRKTFDDVWVASAWWADVTHQAMPVCLGKVLSKQFSRL